MSRIQAFPAYLAAAVALSWVTTGCGGGGTQTQPPPAQTYSLTVNSANPASGVSVNANPADNNSRSSGATSFTLSYNAGTTVTLTAPSAAGGNSFSSWTGCATATGVTCTITMNASAAVTANYAAPPPPTYTLTINSANPASGVTVNANPPDNNSHSSGSTSFTLTYNAGTSVVLTAPSTAAGNSFSSWSECGSTSANVCTVTMNANTTVTATYSSPPPTTYVLTVKSTSPSSGIAIGVSPADNSAAGNGATTFTRTYNAGTSVTLSAPLSADGYTFASWSGCTSNPIPSTCALTMNANATVTAAYYQQGITSITVSPSAATIGTPQQFTATVNGNGSFSKSVIWSLSCPACGNLSPGTFSSSGLYVAPYPAPASVVITANSTQTPSISGSVTVALNPPAATAGPALTVDAGKPTHPISPDIYGMNGYTLSSATAKAINLPVDRWGGGATSRYNYLLEVTNSASDWYFENNSVGTGTFDAKVQGDAAVGAKTMGTVPVLGWVAKDSSSCSFPKSVYPNQMSFDQWRPNCGNGVYPQGVSGCTDAKGCNITGNANTTDIAIDSTWAGNWVAHLVSKFGKAANGGVAIYDLDNEPAWWDAVHRDVHPLPSTYDEVTTNGIAAAKAIKNADSTAAVSGPVVDYWWNYFYSKKDIENGWSSGSPCWEPWSHPVDRDAHGGIPFVEYYLQQFKSASDQSGARLLDYLDLHTYFAGTYNGASVAFTTAKDTEEQIVRLDSTRVFWDPTYSDPNYPQPNYPTDTNYTTNCNTPLQAPQLIPMAQKWVARDYPGTKIAFTEYNWGGQENINGAVAQADILGIFGKYGLDLATLWGPPDPTTQAPGLMAFEIYRNYDGKNSMFGETALDSSSDDQGKLAVYSAVRTSDGALTIIVINKTYGALNSALTLDNLASSATSAQVYQYSNANLGSIAAMASAAITPPVSGSTASTIGATFPAQSITLFVIPR